MVKECNRNENEGRVWGKSKPTFIFFATKQKTNSLNLRRMYIVDLQFVRFTLFLFLQRDKELEAQALDWVEANLGEPIDRKTPYEDVLRDGIILCKWV